MKFGNHLASKIHEPWRSHYFDYNTIKMDMKQRQLLYGWTKTDEAEFFKKMESELCKVYTFIDKKLAKLNTRFENQNRSLDQLMSVPNASKNKYDMIADQLTEILFDTNDLAKFAQLNMTGFEKMLKKHDRYTKLDMTSRFRQLCTTWPIEKLVMAFDVLIVRISDLNDTCHLHGNPRVQHTNNDQTNFERATAKYWVHPDYITEVKSIILYHLPVHVFNKDKPYEESDMAVSSVYYDNDGFDLFSERLNRTEGAEAIRLRWYGPNKNSDDDIYVERKTHKAPWLGGKSVKDRFRLKESQVNSFISGKLTADHIADEIRKKCKDKKNVEELVKSNHFIASGVQKSMKERKLYPRCRVFYNRTAFQLPGQQSLRISLDCNLTFIKEEGREPVSATQFNWRRNDVGINYPFHNVAEKDISRFPYAILETKLQTHLGQQPPAWLTSLINSHLVFEVPCFSKYLHGAATLYKDTIPFVPHWIPIFDQDIRKPPVTDIGLSRSMSFKPLVNGHHRQSLMVMYEKEQQEMFSKSKSMVDLRGDRPHLSISFLESGEERPKEGLNRLWNFGSRKKKAKVQEDTTNIGTAVVVEGKKGKGKKIEPKTFFANERTFISWLQFCALLLTVALNLINNGDHISRVIGAIFIVMSSVMCL